MINIPVEVGTKYLQFGTFLLDDTNGARVKIMVEKYHYDAEQINTEIFREWLIGRGKQPVIWATLVDVLRDTELSALAKDIEAAKCPARQGYSCTNHKCNRQHLSFTKSDTLPLYVCESWSLVSWVPIHFLGLGPHVPGSNIENQPLQNDAKEHRTSIQCYVSTLIEIAAL